MNGQGAGMLSPDGLRGKMKRIEWRHVISGPAAARPWMAKKTKKREAVIPIRKSFLLFFVSFGHPERARFDQPTWGGSNPLR
jgi:hypothetical protein